MRLRGLWIWGTSLIRLPDCRGGDAVRLLCTFCCERRRRSMPLNTPCGCCWTKTAEADAEGGAAVGDRCRLLIPSLRRQMNICCQNECTNALLSISVTGRCERISGAKNGVAWSAAYMEGWEELCYQFSGRRRDRCARWARGRRSRQFRNSVLGHEHK